MKKLMITATVALCAAVGSQALESANVVGYTTKAITQDTFYMVGVQFQNVGADAVADFNKVMSMSGIQAVGYDDMEEQAARIDVLVGGTYTSYYYINDAYDSEGLHDGDVWADENGDMITDADLLALGEGFWFIAKNATAGATLTVAGEVSEASSLSISFPGSKTFVIKSNPFPAAVNLADVTATGITAVGYDDMEDDATRLDVLVGGTYTSYYYINDAYDSEGPHDGDVWADENGDMVEDEVIDAGAGFWVCSPNAGTLTFSL